MLKLKVCTMKRNGILTLLILCLSSISFAQHWKKYGIANTEDLPRGLAVGTMAPQVNVFNEDGEMQPLLQLNANYQVVLFYRGDWCGHCSKYISNLMDSVQSFQRADAKIIAIAPRMENMIASPSNKSMRHVVDTDFNAAKSYKGLFKVTEAYQEKLNKKGIDLPYADSTAYLPVPATYVIAPSGEIIFRHFDYDYAKRARIKDLIDAIYSHRD
jgi:peroxiredoxin